MESVENPDPQDINTMKLWNVEKFLIVTVIRQIYITYR